jgi:3-phosphoglycerate kinase
MANTFLFAQDKNIGVSLYEKNFKSTAKHILGEAKKIQL